MTDVKDDSQIKQKIDVKKPSYPNTLKNKYIDKFNKNAGNKALGKGKNFHTSRKP